MWARGRPAQTPHSPGTERRPHAATVPAACAVKASAELTAHPQDTPHWQNSAVPWIRSSAQLRGRGPSGSPGSPLPPGGPGGAGPPAPCSVQRLELRVGGGWLWVLSGRMPRWGAAWRVWRRCRDSADFASPRDDRRQCGRSLITVNAVPIRPSPRQPTKRPKTTFRAASFGLLRDSMSPSVMWDSNDGPHPCIPEPSALAGGALMPLIAPADKANARGMMLACLRSRGRRARRAPPPPPAASSRVFLAYQSAKLWGQIIRKPLCSMGAAVRTAGRLSTCPDCVEVGRLQPEAPGRCRLQGASLSVCLPACLVLAGSGLSAARGAMVPGTGTGTTPRAARPPSSLRLWPAAHLPC